MKIIKKIKFKISADGSSASGKTTASKLIAKKFKMRFLSSGILYRFCALKTIENNNKYNAKLIKKIVKSITLKKLDNKKLYNPEVTRLSSIIAKKPFVRNALKSFQKNITTILVAHRLSTILEAKRIIYFDKGRILADGSHKNLVENNSDYRKHFYSVFK